MSEAKTKQTKKKQTKAQLVIAVQGTSASVRIVLKNWKHVKITFNINLKQ